MSELGFSGLNDLQDDGIGGQIFWFRLVEFVISSVAIF